MSVRAAPMDSVARARPCAVDLLPPHLRRPESANAVAQLFYDAGGKESDWGGGPQWCLRGSPAVVLMAGKLFSGATCSTRRDSVWWPAAASAFEDLLMLSHRYPIEVSATARQAWNDQYETLLAAHAYQADAVATRHGTTFRGTLRPFQEEGLRFLLGHRKAILADDMGLGKTPTALAFLAAVDEWPAVIVCQSHVVRHWERKVGEFLHAAPAAAGRRGAPLLENATGLSWITLRGFTPKALTPKADIYLIHYLVVAAWEDLLLARGVKSVVFDEVQELRHQGSRKSDANRALARNARNVVGLSGTPIYNKGAEIYNVVNAVERGALGTRVDFVRTWCNPIDTQVVDHPDVLGRYLCDRGVMLRRRKEDVLAELPAKRRVIEMVTADNAKFAALLREAVALAADAALMRDPFERGRMEAEAIAKTRLATGVAKVAGVIAFLQALLEAGQPTLVFAHHLAVHDAIADAMDAFAPARITGQESMAQKDRAQTRFQDGHTDLCLIALRAATGLDGLQKRARVVVFAEFDWSPAVHWQAEDRAHRMGQRDSVLAYYLATDLGTDPAMMATLNLKESQFVGLMNDRAHDEGDDALAQAAADAHKSDVLAMLRSKRAA